VVPKKTNSRPKIVDDESSAKAPSQKVPSNRSKKSKKSKKSNESNLSKAQDQLVKSSFVAEKPNNKPVVILLDSEDVADH
jgi:polyphosphate kinase 2 (PPK2 family)